MRPKRLTTTEVTPSTTRATDAVARRDEKASLRLYRSRGPNTVATVYYYTTRLLLCTINCPQREAADA